MVAQDFEIAVVAVDGPRTDEHGVRPCRAAVARETEGFWERNKARNGAVLRLGVPHVHEPFAKESIYIHVKGSGADKRLGVPGPTEALVALGAVGGHFQEVALLTPEDIVFKLV